jgi:hypothetical protein
MQAKPTGKKVAKKKANPMAEMFRRMDAIYTGARATIEKGKANGTYFDPDVPMSRRAASDGKAVKSRAKGDGAVRQRVVIGEADPKILAYIGKLDADKMGACGVIRDVAKKFPEASVAMLRACLPKLNPSTVQIQTKKARS